LNWGVSSACNAAQVDLASHVRTCLDCGNFTDFFAIWQQMRAAFAG